MSSFTKGMGVKEMNNLLADLMQQMGNLKVGQKEFKDDMKSI